MFFDVLKLVQISQENHAHILLKKQTYHEISSVIPRPDVAQRRSAISNSGERHISESIISMMDPNTEILFRTVQTRTALTRLKIVSRNKNSWLEAYFIYLPLCLWELVPYSRTWRKNRSPWDEMLSETSEHFLRRPYEPSHEIMALFALYKLIFETRLRSHPVGHDVWFLVRPFVYFQISCVRTAKVLARLRGYAGSPGPSLVAYVISTIISWAGSYDEWGRLQWALGQIISLPCWRSRNLIDVIDTSEDPLAWRRQFCSGQWK